MMEQSEIMTRYEQIVLNLLEDNEKLKSHVKKLELALEKISKERTLWGAMRKADHALGRFEQKALEGKDGLP
jgi:hypothetical protein